MYEKGRCRYGDACCFAHGLRELRNGWPRVVPCPQFFGAGFCEAGACCPFSHCCPAGCIDLSGVECGLRGAKAARLPVFERIAPCGRLVMSLS